MLLDVFGDSLICIRGLKLLMETWTDVKCLEVCDVLVVPRLALKLLPMTAAVERGFAHCEADHVLVRLANQLVLRAQDEKNRGC